MSSYLGGSACEPERPEVERAQRRRAQRHPRDQGHWSPAELEAAATRMAAIEALCESPIERQFATAATLEFLRLGLSLVPQYRLEPYRFDFAVLDNKGKLLALVECDGKAFHVTPEQQQNDHRKNLFARDLGVLMLRYSGAALFRDARDCAEHARRTIVLAWSAA